MAKLNKQEFIARFNELGNDIEAEITEYFIETGSGQTNYNDEQIWKLIDFQVEKIETKEQEDFYYKVYCDNYNQKEADKFDKDNLTAQGLNKFLNGNQTNIPIPTLITIYFNHHEIINSLMNNYNHYKKEKNTVSDDLWLDFSDDYGNSETVTFK